MTPTLTKLIEEWEARLDEVLNWRSDDFAHDSYELMTAQSFALHEIGATHERTLQMLKIAIEALEEIFKFSSNNCWERDEAQDALAKLEALAKSPTSGGGEGK